MVTSEGRRSSKKARKRKRKDGNDTDDGDGITEDHDNVSTSGSRKKIKRGNKVQIAVHKLECDGIKPTCGNCSERSLVCNYIDVMRRRGLGQKTLTRMKDHSLRGQESAPGTPNDTDASQPESEDLMSGSSQEPAEEGFNVTYPTRAQTEDAFSPFETNQQ